MTIGIYIVASFILILCVFGLGRNTDIRTAFVRTSGVFSFGLAFIALLAPFRFDVTTIGPVSYPVSDDAARLTEIAFAFAYYSAAIVLAGNGMHLLTKDTKNS